MTNLIQMDFSLPWMTDIFCGLKRGVSDILVRETEEDWFDGVFVLEHREELLGLAAVLAQTYIDRTWVDLGKAGVPRPSDLKWRLMHTHARKIKDHPGVSAVELLYHLADYWKHSDDWPDWNPVDRRKHTILTLFSLGIEKNTEFPCVKGMEKISPSIENLFTVLLDTLASWRESLVEYHRVEGLFERQDGNAQHSEDGIRS